MKFTPMIIAACAALPLGVAAQSALMSTAPQGYMARGSLMLADGNYTGAAHQLGHIDHPSAEARLAIAMSHFGQDRPECLDELAQLIDLYPASHLVPAAWTAIGDFHFFHGRYGEAAKAYAQVPPTAPDAAAQLTLAYRHGFSLLRLGELDAAAPLFARLAASRQYAEAGTFFEAYIDYARGNYDAAEAKFASVTKSSELQQAANYYICQILFTRHEYSRVVELARTLLADEPAREFSCEMNRLAGESLYHEGNNDDDAARFLNAYVDSCESSPERTSLYVLGVLDYRNREFASCISRMEGVTAEVEDAMAQSAWLLTGHAHTKQGSPTAAAMAYEKAFRLPFEGPTQETAFFNYALTQASGARTPFNRSIDFFEQFLNKYPRSSYVTDVEDYLINAYVNGNDYERALESISHIKSPSARVLAAKERVLYNLGIQSLSNGKIADAFSHFHLAHSMNTAADPALHNECNLWMAECHYRRGNYKAAAKCQEAFIAGTNARNANFALAHYNLGYSRFQLRSYAAARQAFEKAAAAKSLAAATRADAYSRIGDCLYYAKSYSEAAAAYDRAYSTHHPSGDYPLFQKAVMMGLTKSHDAKIAIINRLLKEYPNSPIASAAMMQKADAFVAQGDSEAAVSAYDDISSHYKGSADARKAMLQKAITLRGMGNDDRAIDSYKRLISQYPSSDEAKTAAEDLKLIFADRGDLQAYIDFLNSVPGAPRLDVSEIDRLTFESAEKAYIAQNPSIDKMRDYVKQFPNGAYLAKARYYIASHEYKAANYDAALSIINEALATDADAAFADDALAMKADILFRKKKLSEAQAAYEDLASRAASLDNKLNAQLGIMRTAMELEQYGKVHSSADALLALGSLSPEEEKEATFCRAFALKKLKKGSEAIDDFARLAQNTQSIYGARAAWELADYYYQADNLKRAEKVLNDLIDAGTPHQYWLARGFILLADVYHKRGNVTEARQYLESLRNNYPGSETDVFRMIDSRLAKWKKSSKKKK